MDERKIDLSALGLLAAFLNALRSAEIPYEYFQDEDGSFFCECEKMTVHGEGKTLDDAVNDLIENLREVSEAYCEDLPYWFLKNPGKVLYVLKIMMSNDEELKSCLAGEICEDF